MMTMKSFMMMFVAMALMCVSVVAMADDDAHPYHADISQSMNKPVPFKVGMLFDISAPSGMALGMEARLPRVPWFKLQLAGTGTLAPGMRGGVLIDPIKFPIAPVANIDVGHQFPLTIPSLANSPSIDFTYVDFQGGLTLGGRDGFRFMLMAGMSYLTGDVHNFQGVLSNNNVSGLTIGDPHFNGWVPNAKIGFNVLF
jgi:hypothetical protein